ncbi:class I SAM-dependent methyltransferase [Comamonadaceae bacterium OH2545_COT-014]|nr:class I SAM-dependent methyltransferase [Comamonadaceae bacterium OH2545_COT-014]
MHATCPPSAPAPSPWIERFAPLIAPGAPVLDVACGHGRHLRWLARRGHPVTGVDRDPAAVAAVAEAAAACDGGKRVEAVQADIENGPWPLPGRRFGAVVVTNYLWRPLLPVLFDSVADGGVLLYETFAQGHETIGRPANPDFLLRPGELLAAAAAAGPGWRVVAYEDGFTRQPERFVQRLAAVREGLAATAVPARYGLD